MNDGTKSSNHFAHMNRQEHRVKFIFMKHKNGKHFLSIGDMR